MRRGISLWIVLILEFGICNAPILFYRRFLTMLTVRTVLKAERVQIRDDKDACRNKIHLTASAEHMSSYIKCSRGRNETKNERSKYALNRLHLKIGKNSKRNNDFFYPIFKNTKFMLAVLYI